MTRDLTFSSSAGLKMMLRSSGGSLERGEASIAMMFSRRLRDLQSVARMDEENDEGERAVEILAFHMTRRASLLFSSCEENDTFRPSICGSLNGKIECVAPSLPPRAAHHTHKGRYCSISIQHQRQRYLRKENLESLAPREIETQIEKKKQMSPFDATLVFQKGWGREMEGRSAGWERGGAHSHPSRPAENDMKVPPANPRPKINSNASSGPADGPHTARDQQQQRRSRYRQSRRRRRRGSRRRIWRGFRESEIKRGKKGKDERRGKKWGKNSHKKRKPRESLPLHVTAPYGPPAHHPRPSNSAYAT
ncbi:hypothetical protein KC349_g191 [Hortaea werneckii]|nr:hypothetical protein KC349_g191 [Hortaea werneckii]